jgi:hypothetical protein
MNGAIYQFFWAILNPIMDIFFCLDISVNFSVSYYDDGELVYKAGDSSGYII